MSVNSHRVSNESSNRWTSEEQATLQALYIDGVHPRAMEPFFPGRTRAAIKRQITKNRRAWGHPNRKPVAHYRRGFKIPAPRADNEALHLRLVFAARPKGFPVAFLKPARRIYVPRAA